MSGIRSGGVNGVAGEEGEEVCLDIFCIFVSFMRTPEPSGSERHFDDGSL